MHSVSGSVSGNSHAMVARRTDAEGVIRSEQSISPGGGTYSFSLDRGDKVELVDVSAHEGAGEAPAPTASPAAAA